MSDSLERIGRALWCVEFMADYLDDIETRLDEDADADAWYSEVDDIGTMLRSSVVNLKKAILALPPELVYGISVGFKAEDGDASARGAASCLLANIQREISEAKGGSA